MECNDIKAAKFFASILHMNRQMRAVGGVQVQLRTLTQSQKLKENCLWIPFNIKAPICVKPVASDPPEICQCNLAISEHSEVTRNPVLKKRFETSNSRFVQIPTDTFGELEYPANNYLSQFVRMSDEEDFSTLTNLFETVWDLSRPQLVLSFYGDNIESSTTRESLKKLIWKTSETTLTWVITDGLQNGISPIVSEAVKQYTEAYGSGSVEALGIVPWRRVCYIPGLISTEYLGSYPVPYTPATPGMYRYESLDANMTHHLFIDSDQRPWHRVVFDFRVKFEKKLREWISADRGSEAAATKLTAIQTCGILAGGDFDTLATVVSAVSNGMPFVLLRNSGGLADILAECVDAIELGERNQRKKAVTEGTFSIEPFELSIGNIHRTITSYWYDIETPEIAALMIRTLLSNMNMLCICDVEEEELDYHVLLLLLGTAKDDQDMDTTFDKLEIAIALNRSDVAREKVFLDGMKWDNNRFGGYMTTFLIRENVPFIKLFLEKGFDMKSYVTCDVLEKLYTQSLHNVKTVKALLNVIRGFMELPERISLVLVGKVLTLLMGNRYYPLYLDPTFDNADNPDDLLKDCPASHLFIWALLTERKEVAELFWTQVQEPLAATLLAASLLRKFATYANSIVNRDELIEISNSFEEKAHGLLNECFVDDPENSAEALVRDRPLFGHMSCLMLAAEGQSMSFITHRCSEQYLENVWCGSVERQTNKFSFLVSLLVGMVMPLLIPFSVKFDGLPEENAKETKDKSIASERVLSGKFNDGNEDYQRKSQRTTRHNYISHLLAFYRAPSVRFAYTTMAHLIFLCLFTYTLLFYEPRQTKYDLTLNLVLLFWVLTLLIENVRQIVISGLSLRVYIRKVWKTLELIAIILYLLGICLHLMLISESIVRFEENPINPVDSVQSSLLRLADIFYGLSLYLFFYRLLEAFTANMTIGPLVIMVQTMVVEDLIPFLSIFLVSLFSFSILQWAIAFKNTASTSNLKNLRTFFDALTLAYVQTFGEYNVETITTTVRESCTTEGLNCHDEVAPWISPILMGVFVILTQTLLLNLLIAMFASTYGKIEAASTGYWALQRYNVITEYVERSPLPPPLIIIWHIYLLLKRCTKTGRKHEQVHWHPFRKTYENRQGRERQLIHWERLRFWDYQRFVMHGRKRRKNQKTSNVRTTVVSGPQLQNAKQLNSAIQSFQQQTTDAMQEILTKTRSIDEVDKKVDHVIRLLRSLQENMSLTQGTDYLRPLAPVKRQSTRRVSRGQSIKAWSSAPSSDGVQRAKYGNMTVYSGSEHMIAVFTPPTSDNTPSLHATPVPWTDKKSLGETLGWKPTKVKIDGWTESDDYKEAAQRRLYDPMGSANSLHPIAYDKDPVTGAPRNPLGSTGVSGKGHLHVWGPNPAVIIVLTRDRAGLASTSPVVEYAVYKHQFGCQLPWFLVHHPIICDGVGCLRSLVDMLVTSRLRDLELMYPDQRPAHQKALKAYQNSQFKPVYNGYLNDMVNTDNAWIEPHIVNVHLTADQTDSAMVIKLFCTEDGPLEWINTKEQITMREGHRTALQRVLNQAT